MTFQIKRKKGLFYSFLLLGGLFFSSNAKGATLSHPQTPSGPNTKLTTKNGGLSDAWKVDAHFTYTMHDNKQLPCVPTENASYTYLNPDKTRYGLLCQGGCLRFQVSFFPSPTKLQGDLGFLAFDIVVDAKKITFNTNDSYGTPAILGKVEVKLPIDDIYLTGKENGDFIIRCYHNNPKDSTLGKREWTEISCNIYELLGVEKSGFQESFKNFPGPGYRLKKVKKGKKKRKLGKEHSLLRKQIDVLSFFFGLMLAWYISEIIDCDENQTSFGHPFYEPVIWGAIKTPEAIPSR
ncbi:MAG: hypothetical protein ACPGC9_00910 [Cytophagales bacterium]